MIIIALILFAVTFEIFDKRFSDNFNGNFVRKIFLT